MPNCPECKAFAWLEKDISHKATCSKAKQGQPGTTGPSPQTLISQGKSEKSPIWHGNQSQLLEKDRLAKDDPAWANVGTGFIPPPPTSTGSPPQIALPLRPWGRILDDIAEFAATTLSESFDVAAAYLALGNDGKYYLLLSSNSGAKFDLKFDEKEQSFEVKSKGGTGNTPQQSPRLPDISNLKKRDDFAVPTERREGGLQSLARMIEANRAAGLYASDKEKVERILSAIKEGRVSNVSPCGIFPEMHAEIKIVNLLCLDRPLWKPAFPKEDYIGTSKPFCAFCNAFLQWWGSQGGGLKFGGSGHHGEVYARPWTGPCCAGSQKWAPLLEAALKKACGLNAIKADRRQCKGCGMNHPVCTPAIADTLDVSKTTKATSTVTRSRSPTRELRDKFT